MVAVCAILVVGAALWIVRYPALYYFYLWRLDHTKWVEDLHEDIESISPHIVPLLVRTYEDVNASGKRRHAAAYGLIKADRKRADALFIRFLDNEDDEIVRLAIWDLAIAESDKSFERIIRFAHHPNERIRLAVAYYLGNFSNAESISVLSEMEANDPDKSVRSEAGYHLQVTISHLSPAKSDTFKTVLGFAHHPNETIRLDVAEYLGYFNNDESIAVLTDMQANDPDERVRDLAGHKLQRLGVLP